jgi:ATP-binding cassette subfamily B (MDR/TAP) protein 1
MMYRSSVEIDYAHDESVISKETADVVGSPVDGTTPLQRGLVGSLELLESHAESVLVGGGGGGAAAADAKLPSSGPLHQQTVSPKKKTKGTVPFYKLFSFAAPLDYALMILGTLAAFVHGTSFPVFFIFFSKLINEVAANFFNIPKQSEEVAKYGLYFFYLGIILLGTAWIEVACWMQTGERQSARIRTKYLRAMLAQDIAFFDKDASTGEIVSRISNDTLVVQEAIGEKMGIFLHYLAMFVAGICVSLTALWQITLVTLSVLPIIAVTGGIYITYKTTQASRSQEAYMMASVVAEEVSYIVY